MENLATNDGDGFFFIPSENWPAKPSKHGYTPIPKEEREARKIEVKKRDLRTKIKTTMSSIKSKEIKDPAKYYVIVKYDEKASKTELYHALHSLKATVHAYLNKQHTLILISVDVVTLNNHTSSNSDFPLSIQGPLLDFRELTREEQLGKGIIQDKSWREEAKPVMLHLIPNLGLARVQEYLDRLQDYFKEKNLPILWQASPERGMLITKMNRETAEDLLRRSNFVFNIHGIPRGVASKSDAKPEAPSKIKAKPSSYSANLSLSIDKLPTVCVVDTGLDLIPSLSPLIQKRDAHQSFSNPSDEAEDKEGHGTPIACLAARGEGNGLPRAKIISYKIYSKDNRDVALEGMMNAINKYSDTARIFVSSVNLDDELNDGAATYAELDQLIQEKNICFVSSAGNIEMEKLDWSIPYPKYIEKYPVKHPSQNIQVISVGAITRREKDGSIAKSNQISPFTRFGKSLDTLCDVKKPDVAEHGGNLCIHSGLLDASGIGVASLCKDGNPHNGFAGTSFSAPLVAGRLAEILAKYGDKIKNIETLKALMFLSCNGKTIDYVGNGVPRPFLKPDPNHAVIFSEGTVSLPSNNKEKNSAIPAQLGKVSIPVPNGVGRIDMCLVHSDNLPKGNQPSLNTRLRVYAESPGAEVTKTKPDDETPTGPSHVKFFSWGFKSNSMKGIWKFYIAGDTTSHFPPDVAKTTTIRYGCAILLTYRKFIPPSLTFYVKKEMEALGRIAQ
ncbi:MAG: S8 family serine peptidase [Thaumarchaeota archaeon]|nr:S8 family serine peptidase [Nitrososphaerota archaeon]